MGTEEERDTMEGENAQAGSEEAGEVRDDMQGSSQRSFVARAVNALQSFARWADPTYAVADVRDRRSLAGVTRKILSWRNGYATLRRVVAR